MTPNKLLTVRFVYAAEDSNHMELVSKAAALAVLDNERARVSRSIKCDENSKPEQVEATFGVIPSLPFNDAFDRIIAMTKSEDVVTTSISIEGEDLITVTHRNAIKPKALELAS